jgi:hypothetical protein
MDTFEICSNALPPLVSVVFWSKTLVPPRFRVNAKVAGKKLTLFVPGDVAMVTATTRSCDIEPDVPVTVNG